MNTWCHGQTGHADKLDGRAGQTATSLYRALPSFRIWQATTFTTSPFQPSIGSTHAPNVSAKPAIRDPPFGVREPHLNAPRVLLDPDL